MKHIEGDKEWIKSFYDAAVDWWGESWYEGENLKSRLEIVNKYTKGTGVRILELAAGTGETAAYLCDHGYNVVAVDISHKNIALLQKIQNEKPNLRVIQGDFLKVRIVEKFPIVCIFETFGFGSDKEQQHLLKRVANEWLCPNGIVIVDVYHPYGPIQACGSKQELDKLEGIPGSVDMIEYSYYDPIKNRWIDIWEPKDDPESRRMQSIRCYTPADFLLLAENCGLTIESMLYNGKEFDFRSSDIVTENIFDNVTDRNYAYTVILSK